MRAPTIVLLAFTAGCIESFDAVDPEIGGATQDRCADQDSDPDNEVSFSTQILPVMKGEVTGVPGCGCHQPTNPNPIGLEQTGLDLSSYSSLRSGGVRSRGTIVVPGKPCSSVVWQKTSAGPPFGARMPFDGPPFLGAGQRRLLADWIAEGARDN